MLTIIALFLQNILQLPVPLFCNKTSAILGLLSVVVDYAGTNNSNIFDSVNPQGRAWR